MSVRTGLENDCCSFRWSHNHIWCTNKAEFPQRFRTVSYSIENFHIVCWTWISAANSKRLIKSNVNCSVCVVFYVDDPLTAIVQRVVKLGPPWRRKGAVCSSKRSTTVRYTRLSITRYRKILIIACTVKWSWSVYTCVFTRVTSGTLVNICVYKLCYLLTLSVYLNHMQAHFHGLVELCLTTIDPVCTKFRQSAYPHSPSH